MGFLDALLGRTRTAKSQTDKIFAMSTAQVALAGRLEAMPSGRAGVVFRPVASSYYEEAEREIQEVLRVSERIAQTRSRLQRDEQGYQWVVLEDEEFDDLVTAIHMVGDSLEAHGFRDRLLAAVFGFRKEGRSLYWIYNYKSARFYPFVPEGRGRQRDNTLEMRLAGAMRKELPLEEDVSLWYGLWGAPL